MAKQIEVILKDFIRHVSDLKAEDDPAGTGFHREFRILREMQIQNKNEEKFPTEDGRKEENIKKNRYKDIIPRDDRRVKLTEIEGEKGSDYINATFIEDVDGKYGYIAAQGPMPHTVNDFWRMMWEYNTEIVFMVCRLKEDGKPKCEKYWAENGEKATYGDITVHTESEEEIQDHFLKRHLRAQKNGETHHLTQFHYTGWPDHNTPSSPDALRTMIEDVRNFRKKLDIPMVVHCSAGCGRTGTICAIDYGWTLLDKGMITDKFSMFEIIKSLREQRMSMVQTPDQYEYTYMVMKSLCNEWLVSFTDHDYENVTISTPTEERPEETYSNIEFNDQGSSKESAGSARERVVSIGDVPKETNKPTRSSRLSASDKPEVTQQKPGKVPKETDKPTTNSKPSLNNEPEVRQQKPDVVKPKPQAAATIQTANSTQPKTFTTQDREAGEYVEVRTTASLPATSPPGLPDKKNPPLNTTKSNPFKTVITLGGAQSRIVQTGSVRISSAKQQAPKPTAAQAVNAPAVATATPGHHQQQVQRQQQQQQQQRQQQQQQQQQQMQRQRAASDDVHGQTAKKTLVMNRQDKNVDNYENSLPRGVSEEEAAPVLPDRRYKPEEITENSTSSPTDNDSHRHAYDNVKLGVSPQTQATLSPRTIDNRSPQPLPRSQSPTRPAVPQMTSLRPAGHPGQMTSHQPAGLRGQAVPGMVSAMGGHPEPMVRRGSAKVVGSQPDNVRAGAGGPVVMQARQPLSAGARGRPRVSPQLPFVIKKGGKYVFHTERPPRVKGPRSMPPGWTTISKNQHGTYL